MIIKEFNPKFKTGDVLTNKEDGSRITIIALVSDQYKYLEEGHTNEEDALYDFTDCIEASYIKKD